MSELRDSNPEVMKQAFRCLPTGVTIISYYDEAGEPAGMTANAVCSVSLTPPLLLACLNQRSRTWSLIQKQRRFGVNILSTSQRLMAERCAIPGQDKRLDWEWIEHGLPGGVPPAIRHSLGFLNCLMDAAYEAGTHAIVIGRVEHILLSVNQEPLAYFRGAYRQLDPSPESRVEAMWDLLARLGY